MKKRILAASLLLLLISPGSFCYEITAKLKNFLDEIGKTHYEVLRVRFGNFTYEYSSPGGSFSRFLEEKLKGAIAQSDYFELFARDALEISIRPLRMSTEGFSVQMGLRLLPAVLPLSRGRETWRRNLKGILL